MSSDTKEIKENKKEIKSLDGLINLLEFTEDKPLSFALYRLPGNEDSFEFAGTYNKVQSLNDIVLEELPKGFVISSFSGKSWFLQADIYWDSASNNLEFKNDTKIHFTAEKKPKEKPTLSSLFSLNQSDSTPEIDEKYVNLVTDAIDYIKSEKVHKLVPARRKTIQGTITSNLFSDFEKLCTTYPNAFVSLISTPETGTWMGASPEILVSTKENTFQTVSVAGTQVYNNQVLSQVAWTQKEIEEQALVSRYIINCFKKIRLREFDEMGPKTVIAGNLLHLKSTFTVDMNSTGFPELGSVMLKLLHPTSAVCGMPLEGSRAFLLENEGFDRKLFSGFLGPVIPSKNTSLFVNIRCMEVHPDSVTLYAGAGVTADSIPEKELAETNQKFATLENIILKN